MTEPSPDHYADFYDAKGQPVRRGVVLSEDEAREYALFYGETTPQTATTEETTK
jgi:hypothetical protein